MSANGRPALRGQGYMKKGGAHATRAHNDAARAAAAAAPVIVAEAAARPATDAGRVDGRASDRPRDLWTAWTSNAYPTFAAVVGSAVATSCVWAAVLTR